VATPSSDAIDWDDLRYFLRAAEAKTLAGAARAMRVEHTTVGRRLSALERALGATVMLRTPNGLELTALGESLLPLAHEIERAVAAVSETVATRKTRVRLAVPSGFTHLFAPYLGELRRDHPDLSLEVVSGSRPVDLTRGEADLAIRIGPVSGEGLVSRKLGDASSALYASEAYLARRGKPTNVDDLRGHDVIAYDRSLAAIPSAKWIEDRIAGATVVLRCREMTELVSAAANGLGLAVLSCALADFDPSLRRLSGVLNRRPLSLVYRRERRGDPQIRAVIAFIVAVVRRHAPRFAGP
jgi:DNA-binding transcriptional LysR family regulator